MKKTILPILSLPFFLFFSCNDSAMDDLAMDIEFTSSPNLGEANTGIYKQKQREINVIGVDYGVLTKESNFRFGTKIHNSKGNVEILKIIMAITVHHSLRISLVLDGEPAMKKKVNDSWFAFARANYSGNCPSFSNERPERVELFNSKLQLGLIHDNLQLSGRENTFYGLKYGAYLESNNFQQFKPKFTLGLNASF